MRDQEKIDLGENWTNNFVEKNGTDSNCDKIYFSKIIIYLFGTSQDKTLG